MRVRDPYALDYESGLEPVLAVSVSSKGGGRLDITFPLTTVIEVFPGVMKAFTIAPSSGAAAAAGGEHSPDLWFRRTVRFPIYHASLN